MNRLLLQDKPFEARVCFLAFELCALFPKPPQLTQLVPIGLCRLRLQKEKAMLSNSLTAIALNAAAPASTLQLTGTILSPGAAWPHQRLVLFSARPKKNEDFTLSI